MKKRMRDIQTLVRKEGYSILDVQPAKGTHHKLRLRAKDGTHFMVVCSISDSDQHSLKNFRSDIHKAHRNRREVVSC